MRVVVDASVAMKWLVAEEGSDAADRLLTDGDDLYAPRLMASEVANALWRKARLSEIDRDQAAVLMTAVSELPVCWCEDEAVCADAVRLALKFERPVCDFMYLALAQRHDARMVTADERFANALASTEHRGTVTTLVGHAQISLLGR